MERRNFLSVSALAAAGLVSSNAMAATEPAETHKKLAEIASQCAASGEVCIAHCMKLLKQGDKSISGCIQTAMDMVASCKALATIANNDTAKTDSFKALTASCAKFCRDCMEECKKHVNHHEVCKNCFEHCEMCAKACDAA